jgi:alkylation response protein AidB-like acyl-CoA dehydrogenase
MMKSAIIEEESQPIISPNAPPTPLPTPQTPASDARTTHTSRQQKIGQMKRVVDSFPRATTVTESYDAFMRLYGMATPEEWLDVDFMSEITNHIALERADCIDLGIRITVQVNLFLQTVQSYSTDPDQIISEWGSKPACFALTEDGAGILSGLVVDTKFKEIPGKDGTVSYTLNTVTCKKQWISQGLMATHCLVFASNEANHRDCRIFHLNFADHGKTIVRTPMVGADVVEVNRCLDLAQLQLVNVVCDDSAVLEKTIAASRRQLLEGVLRGRVVISEVVTNSMLGHVRHIKRNVEGQEAKFAAIPHLNLIRRWERELESYALYLRGQRDVLLETNDIQRINCHKVYVTETAIAMYARLAVLFGTKTFGHGLTLQTLTINKVAEGDATVLRLAIVGEHFGKGLGTVLRGSGTSWLNLAGVLGARALDATTKRVGGLVERVGLPRNTDLTRAYVFTHLDSLSQDIIRATVRTMDVDVVSGYR